MNTNDDYNADIYLNEVFGLSDKEISESKIEFNIKAGKDGETFIDRWLDTPQRDRMTGRTQCSFWGWYGNKRNYRVGDTAFSFIRLSNDEWLFVSAARITDVIENSRAEYEILERFRPFFGRLIVRYAKGNTYARYVFKMRDRIDDITVKEILSEQYSGERFCGYDKVSLTYAELASIVNRRPFDWVGALRHQKAVYVIADESNGKLYVGSATDESGMLLARWSSYVSNGHGGNVELKTLVGDKGFDYVKSNFRYSIIENYNAKIDDGYVLEREAYWKRVLSSRNGYNKN